MPALVPEEIRIQQISALPNIEFLGWLGGYSSNKSRAIVKCSIDENIWTPNVNHLMNGRKCPECAKRISADARRLPQESVEQALSAIPEMNFIGWERGRYENNESKAIMSCNHGHQWSAIVSNLKRGSNCPKCAAIKSTIPRELRESQINDIDGISFLRWSSEYSGISSIAVVKCECGNEWEAEAHGLLRGYGCRVCGGYGYNDSKKGYLYALISDDKEKIKIGISNNHHRRIHALRRDTPFSFDVMKVVEDDDGLKIRMLEKYFHGKYERAALSKFDGYTEWLIATDELISEIEAMGH